MAKRLSKKVNKAIFKKGAVKSKSINNPPVNLRGGIRL